MSVPPPANETYFIAPYVIDGELVGVEPVKLASLSSRWIGVCRDLIEVHGLEFEESLEGPLSHLRIKYTSAKGAALILVSVHERPAVSGVFASGLSDETDLEALGMFAASAAQSLAKFRAIGRNSSFAGLATISERPLLVVIPYADALLTDEEYGLAKELMQHVAAAHMRQLPGPD
jgi:hypothetical protein